MGLSVANTRGLTALQIVHVRIISTGDELLLWLDYIFIGPLLSILVCQTTATIIVARSVFFLSFVTKWLVQSDVASVTHLKGMRIWKRGANSA